MTVNFDKRVVNPVYRPLLTDYTHKTEVYYGGAGSGKSYFVAQKLILKSLSSTRTVLIVRKTLTSQLRSCWKLVTDILGEWKLDGLCKINVSTYQITLPNQSVIYFAGLDNSERIKSIVGITDMWLEECTELTLDDYSQLLLRMRANVDGSQVYCSFNPVSKSNWVYSRWFSDSPTDTTALITKTTYRDNPHLPKSYTEELEKMIETNPTYYKIYALGDFCTLDRLVYSNWKVEEVEGIDGIDIFGLDFGYTNDPTAFIHAIVKDKDLYLVGEWFSKGRTNDEIAEFVKGTGYSKEVIIADSAEQKSIEELKRAGLYRIKASVKGKDSILNGIQLLQQYRIHVSPSCQHLIEELSNYTWQKDKNTNEYINKPIDTFNHGLDALRYSIQSVNKGGVKILNKGIFGTI